VLALAGRDDEPLVRGALRTLRDEPSAARAHLKRIESIRWLERRPELLLRFSDDEQAAAVTMIVASGMPRLKALDALKIVLDAGSAAARRAAAAALAEFPGAQANQMVLARLDDRDPVVQAALVAQLRERGIPTALALLLERVDSPHAEVRQAAAESLAEFRFERYLAAFDTLSDEARTSTGALVRKIDKTAIEGLAKELASNSRPRRLRALEAAPYLDAVADLSGPLMKLLVCEDAIVRAAAQELLDDARANRVWKPLIVFDSSHAMPNTREGV
jgi:HEAT repeat protein